MTTTASPKDLENSFEEDEEQLAAETDGEASDLDDLQFQL